VLSAALAASAIDLEPGVAAIVAAGIGLVAGISLSGSV